MGMVRVIEGQSAAVRHPETGMHVVPDPRVAYRDDDPLVKAYPWMFASDNEPGEVEQATAAPGEKRTTRRRS